MPKLLIFDAFTLLICKKNVANHALLQCKSLKILTNFMSVLPTYHWTKWRKKSAKLFESLVLRLKKKSQRSSQKCFICWNRSWIRRSIIPASYFEPFYLLCYHRLTKCGNLEKGSSITRPTNTATWRELK